MSQTMLGYKEQDSPIHRLTGTTKLILLLMLILTAMLTYDTRVLLATFGVSIIAFKCSKIKFKEVAVVSTFILIFLGVNALAIFIFSPLQGVEIYGTKHDIVHIAGPYVLTWEQLFYEFNVVLKYISVIPMALLFMVATHPSEFAASLNRIGVSYKLAYAVAIALRYIPDIQRDYQDIAFAQQARGLDLSKKEKLMTRIKNMTTVLTPLIFASLERIETISCAMELRAFGSQPKRTWYSAKAFTKYDYLVIGGSVAFFIWGMWLTFSNGTRFYNPFI